MVTDTFRAVVYTGLAAAGYFASAQLGYAFAVGGTVTLWPPAGLMLGLLVLAPTRRWPWLVIGGLIGSFLSDLIANFTVPLAIAAALANGLEALIGAAVMKRLLGSPVRFATLRAVGALAVVVVASNAVTAIPGAAMLHAGGLPLIQSYFIWWVGDGLGMLIVAPVVLTWFEAVRQRQWLRRSQTAEAAALVVILAATARLCLGPVPGWAIHPGPYFLFPVLLWAALRFGLIGAATATLLVAGAGTWYASLNTGPFTLGATSHAAVILEAYAFLGVASITSLVAAAALAERQAAITQLGESRESYRNVVETATDAIITIDEKSRIQFANSATERIFGYSLRELIGQDIGVLMPGAMHEAHKAGVARYVATGEHGTSWQGTQLIGLHKNGRHIPLEASFGEASEAGRHRFTGILRDISEKRAAERALEELEDQYRQSQKMEAIGQLAGGIAHDFNNLLTIVQVNCELLIEQLGQSRLRPEIQQIRTAATRAAALTHQLLAFSRRQILAPRAVNLADTLADVIPMLRRLIGEDVLVDLKLPTPVGPIMADPGQLEQVIFNLAINARDAMPEGGVLTFELSEVLLDEGTAHSRDVLPGRYARMAVIDTGLGMEPEVLDRVFEPFFTTKPMGRGTGLGLSTVHGIVKQSGGGIRVESEPGAGSTFEVYLPRVDAAPPNTHDGHQAHAPESRRATVLVVEDEEEVAHLTQRILERQGFRVLVAFSPREALDIAAREPAIDVLLSDVVLPEMSGRVLADRLLAKRPSLKVLYMSGYTDDALSHHGVLDPGIAFIEKPFSAKGLVRRLREVISEPRARRM